MDNEKRTYGLGGWILGTTTYNDEYPGVSVSDETRSATRTATFVGTLHEAVQSAPELGSTSDTLDEDLRLHKRTFTEDAGVVTLTMTYAIFSASGDGASGEESDPTYSLDAEPGSVALLSAKRFEKEPELAREIARMYVIGKTDSSIVYYKNGEKELYDKRPEKPSDPAEAAKWRWARLSKLANEYAPGSKLVNNSFRFRRKEYESSSFEKLAGPGALRHRYPCPR